MEAICPPGSRGSARWFLTRQPSESGAPTGEAGCSVGGDLGAVGAGSRGTRHDPVRAGMVSDPADYRWSAGAAMGRRWPSRRGRGGDWGGDGRQGAGAAGIGEELSGKWQSRGKRRQEKTMERRSVSGDGGAAGAGFLKVYPKKDADGPRMALIITDL